MFSRLNNPNNPFAGGNRVNAQPWSGGNAVNFRPGGMAYQAQRGLDPMTGLPWAQSMRAPSRGINRPQPTFHGDSGVGMLTRLAGMKPRSWMSRYRQDQGLSPFASWLRNQKQQLGMMPIQSDDPLADLRRQGLINTTPFAMFDWL